MGMFISYLVDLSISAIAHQFDQLKDARRVLKRDTLILARQWLAHSPPLPPLPLPKHTLG